MFFPQTQRNKVEVKDMFPIGYEGSEKQSVGHSYYGLTLGGN
jgi:hypothetical protein